MTAEVVGRDPAPAPWNRMRPVRSPSIWTALRAPSTFASSSSSGSSVGCTRACTAESSRRATASSLIAYPSSAAYWKSRGLRSVIPSRYTSSGRPRLTKRDVEGDLFAPHASQDVVSRAVDYRADAGDLVGGKVALEGGDDGDAAADAGLVEDIHSLLSRQRQQLRAVLGHDLLVRRDNVASAGERVLNQLIRRMLAAYQFHDDVHVAGERLLRSHGQEGGIDLDRAPLTGVADEDAAQGQRSADTAGGGLR